MYTIRLELTVPKMSETSDEESLRILADKVKRGHASQGDTVSHRLSPR